MPNDVCDTALIDGTKSRYVDCGDRGFQYGDGVFTTMRVAHGRPLLLPLHLDRLEIDTRRLNIPFPGRPILLREAMQMANRLGEGVLKVILTRGRGGRGYRPPAAATGTRVLTCHPIPDYPSNLPQAGARVRFCSSILGNNPTLAGIKHLNRLEQVLARAEWDDDAVHEGLMRDAQGFVVEGVMSNLFIGAGGRLLTPRVDQCGVRGVMRTLVMRLAAAAGLPVEEGYFPAREVVAGEELFLTNSVIGLWPIRQLEDRAYPVGPLTRWMAARVGEALHGDETCRA